MTGTGCYSRGGGGGREAPRNEDRILFFFCNQNQKNHDNNNYELDFTLQVSLDGHATWLLVALAARSLLCKQGKQANHPVDNVLLADNERLGVSMLCGTVVRGRLASCSTRRARAAYDVTSSRSEQGGCLVHTTRPRERRWNMLMPNESMPNEPLKCGLEPACP